jgi:hypothetical protein
MISTDKTNNNADKGHLHVFHESKIINEDQTGYVKNRFIGFNLRQIQYIIDYADLYKIEGAIIFIDFSKTFYSLEWDFMFGTLKHFRFSESVHVFHESF